MVSKIVVFALLVAAIQGSALHIGDYSITYGVPDPHTGDVKSQHETRVGDSVVGRYLLLDSNGKKRTVDYAFEAHNGFNAVERKDPIYATHAAPVFAVPLAYGAHASPLVDGNYAPSPLGISGYFSPLGPSGLTNPRAYSAGALPYSAPLVRGTYHDADPGSVTDPTLSMPDTTY